MQRCTFAAVAAAIGIMAVAPPGATAKDTCNDGLVKPGTVVQTIASVGSATGLQGFLAPFVAHQLAQVAGTAASLEGEVKLESVCPDGV